MLDGKHVAALLLTIAMLGCGSDDVFFELRVNPFGPGDGCAGPSFNSWVLTVRQGGVEQCARGPCARPNMQPLDCVDGVITPPVEPDETFTITLGLYSADAPPVACAQRLIGNGAEQGDLHVLTMSCESQELMRCPMGPPPAPSCPMQSL
jgi:hypothetical protein